MEELKFFDVNCRVGNTAQRPGPDVSELLADMDYYGVDRALVRHGNMARGGADTTNHQLVDMLEPDVDHRLTGVWCMMPDQCHELPEPDELFRQMKKHRIGALTLSPEEHRYVPCRLSMGRIMDAAAERKIPILLNDFGGKWPELYAFLKDFPKNQTVYIEQYGKWGCDRQIRPLLEAYEHFHFETAGYWVPGGIEELAKLYGADRILWGSGYFRYNQGSGMLQLKQSSLSATDMAKIAGGNLEALLKGAEL